MGTEQKNGPAPAGTGSRAEKQNRTQFHSTENDALLQEIDRLFKAGNRDLAPALLNIAHDLRDYWPLTTRQLYYQAVAHQHVKNTQNEYHRISKILTTLRRNDLLPWLAIADNTRTTSDKRGVDNLAVFLSDEFNNFLRPEYYARCLIQNQPLYVEVAVEKDALASIVTNATWGYCVRVNVLRGQVSATMVNDMADRFADAAMRGKRPLLVHLGDLDPSGVAIPKALIRNIRQHHGVDVELIRAGLNPDQVDGLPVSPDAAKSADPNFATWAAEYGAEFPPYELDALHPKALATLAHSTLAELFNMDDMYLQQQQEFDDRQTIMRIRREVEDYLLGRWPEYFNLGTSARMGGIGHE